MVEELVVGKGESIGHHGKPLHGGTLMHDAIQIICIIPQGSMVIVSNEYISTTGAIPF